MHRIHPLYTYGPYVFLGLSAAVSAAIAPRMHRALTGLREHLAGRRVAKRLGGTPVKSLDQVTEGEAVVVTGVLCLNDGSGAPGELALEQSAARPSALRLTGPLAVDVDGQRVAILAHGEIAEASEVVDAAGTELARLCLGDRVHVSGVVRYGEVERASFRTSARALSLIDGKARPLRLAYAGTAPIRRPLASRPTALACGMLLFWIVGTAFCALAFAVGRFAASRDGDALVGSSVDWFVVAHLAPPLAVPVAHAMVNQLEEGADRRRFAASEMVESRLEQAAALDPSIDASVARWARHHFRTRAGRLAAAKPSDAACEIGLDADADALRDSGVAQLLVVCGNRKGDVGSRAAFKLGDFARAVGPEAEAILSRLPIPPAGEPGCTAGGTAAPPAELPICRLLHAEARPAARKDIVSTLEVEPPFARRWLAALRALRGADLPSENRFTIDPETLVFQPLAALIDEPIAVYAELYAGIEKLSHADAVWVTLALAASASAFGDHDGAVRFASEALERLDLDLAPTPLAPDDVNALRLAAAVLLRADATESAHSLIERAGAGDDDALAAVTAQLGGAAVAPPLLSRLHAPELLSLAPAEQARALAAEAGRASVVAGAFRLLPRTAPGDPRREWLREAFPPCRRCDFYDELSLLLLRRDAAQALADDDVLRDLGPILGRYRAVLENRPLGLVLRAAHGDSKTER